jgi:polyisoprenyl-phosphate glycosyltransferase
MATLSDSKKDASAGWTEGFEGIRAQDILPQLVRCFTFERFYAWGGKKSMVRFGILRGSIAKLGPKVTDHFHRMNISSSRDHGNRNLALLSVIVPCFNEQQVIEETHRSLVATLSSIPEIGFELFYVDDGSRDATLDILRALQQADPRIRVIALSRNFGHQVAITAGLEHSSGDAVVVIDADLQDPPEVILEMLERWRQGVDVAYGVRSEREGEAALKLWTAKAFYRFINRLSDVAIPLDTGDFRLMDREVVNALLAMPERDRFVRGMVAWVGFRQDPVYYRRAARLAGETKYPPKQMLRFATDGIVSFSLLPLRLAVHMGLTTSGLALLGILYALALRLFTDVWVTGWTLLFIAILFLGGVQLLFLGVIGEYVGRIYGEVKHRPLYLVKERLGFEAVTEPTGQVENRQCVAR